MASDYRSIQDENKRRYGTDIGRIGPMLLAHRYDDRTHFIFELLQNAEDALARRVGGGSRTVRFALARDSLRVSHYGKPFDERDVRGICGIAESTKGLGSIGRFGIGFKSVYAYADTPAIHSGQENFAIEHFVWPHTVTPIERADNETVIDIPLKTCDGAAHDEIAAGLGRLGASTLLFLREIEEIAWSVQGGQSGVYLREIKEVDTNVRRVALIGQECDRADIDESWIVFSRAVTAEGDHDAGFVEIAFTLTAESEHGHEKIGRVGTSPLVVFFPTVVETHLGFRLQGPYRTTPSRDNVPRHEAWNQHLVEETAELLRYALCWLRDASLLDTTALSCLPLDESKFGDDTMLSPLFAATAELLRNEPLLPRCDQGYAAAVHARLARTQEMRELFTPGQLASLFGVEGHLYWLSGDITQDKMPELRRYLINELDVAEVIPQAIVQRIDERFLAGQADAWIQNLYEFLNGQTALRRFLADVPLIRLADGSHVVAHDADHPQAFLPGDVDSDFPTVRAAVCETKEAREFLASLGLTEPDPVDDVVRNILPRYADDEVNVDDAAYEDDIRRMLAAFATDSKGQREKLIEALRDVDFVMCVDLGDGEKYLIRPGEVYLATDRFKRLFDGVQGVFLVDDDYDCLRGEDVRELLEACGAARSLQPTQADRPLSKEKLLEIRRRSGLERATWEGAINDPTLRGLDGVLARIADLDRDERENRAALLWEALSDVEARRGSGVFSGKYSWSYSHESKTAAFDAAFVRALNEEPWVPNEEGELVRPDLMSFDALGWSTNPTLESKIRFKPPVVDVLAREAGIEPGVLDLLRKLGVKSEAELRDRLQLNDEADSDEVDARDDGISSGDDSDVAEPDPDDSSDDSRGKEEGDGVKSTGSPGTGGGGSGESSRGGAGTGRDRRSGHDGAQRKDSLKFVSYVGTHPNGGDDEQEFDGLTHEERMALEERAIQFILSRNADLHRTSANNPGFDLYEEDTEGQPSRWVEVKAMTGSMRDRPIGLSRRQFKCAQERGDAYWLYVVEHAGTPDARLVRVNDPAGKAGTFTFDHGWIAVAEVESQEGADKNA